MRFLFTIAGVASPLFILGCSSDDTGPRPLVPGPAQGEGESSGGLPQEQEPGAQPPSAVDGTGGGEMSEPGASTGGASTTLEPGPDEPGSGFGAAIEGGGTEAGYYTFEMSLGGEEYFVQTNPWGGADQTIKAGMGNVFEVVSMVGPGGTEPWQVVSFPSVYKGGGQSGDITEGSGMPVVVSDLHSLRTGLKTNASKVTYKGNTAYDVYFTNGPSYSGGAPDDFLMVWFHANAMNPINSEGEGWSCAGQEPSYVQACTGAGSVMVQGKMFYRFFGYNGEHRVISYVPSTSFDEWEYDLKEFIDDAVTEGFLSASQYLQGVQGGFELIEGGAGLLVSDFYVDVQ